MRVWNLLCIATLAVSAAAADQQPTVEEMVKRLELGQKDYEQLATLLIQFHRGKGTAEAVVDAAKTAGDEEDKNHQSSQPEKAYPTDGQNKICEAYKKHAAAGVRFVNSLRGIAIKFDKEELLVFQHGLEMMRKEVHWFATDIASTAVPSCLEQVIINTHNFLSNIDATIAVVKTYRARGPE